MFHWFRFYSQWNGLTCVNCAVLILVNMANVTTWLTNKWNAFKKSAWRRKQSPFQPIYWILFNQNGKFVRFSKKGQWMMVALETMACTEHKTFIPRKHVMWLCAQFIQNCVSHKQNIHVKPNHKKIYSLLYGTHFHIAQSHVNVNIVKSVLIHICAAF